MFLALDIGNTETAVGVYDGDALTHQWSTLTRAIQTSDQLAAFLLPLFQHHQVPNRWKGAGLCSVVPSANRGARKFCQDYLKLRPLEISSQCPLPLKINVKEPESVGADRLANAAYAVEHLSLPAIIVDFGTATTLDVVSADPAYEGGVILPGVGLAFESLSRSTSKLSLVDVAFPRSVIGKTTQECIQSGILLGYCDQINGLLKRTATELGGHATICLTGGYSGLFADKIENATRCASVTLDGIRLIYKYSV